MHCPCVIWALPTKSTAFQEAAVYHGKTDDGDVVCREECRDESNCDMVRCTYQMMVWGLQGEIRLYSMISISSRSCIVRKIQRMSYWIIWLMNDILRLKHRSFQQRSDWLKPLSLKNIVVHCCFITGFKVVSTAYIICQLSSTVEENPECHSEFQTQICTRIEPSDHQ